FRCIWDWMGNLCLPKILESEANKDFDNTFPFSNKDFDNTPLFKENNTSTSKENRMSLFKEIREIKEIPDPDPIRSSLQKGDIYFFFRQPFHASVGSILF
ncbi:MAG: hypothetical protein OXB93_00020, partial [Cytophagales bacterium]|nr:hypothetical protein [Cytophagales bacterium]